MLILSSVSNHALRAAPRMFLRLTRVVGAWGHALRALHLFGRSRNQGPSAVGEAARRDTDNIGLLEASPLFDTDYYLREYPDVTATGVEPAAHYHVLGWTERRQPHPLFDTRHYLDCNPEVAQEDINPLLHFIRRGSTEGKDPHPLFDTRYYLEHNPDVARCGVNPLVHFARTGGAEGRNPHPLFDTRYYLDRNPEVAEQGINPLVHFLRHSGSEGKKPHPLFDTRYYLDHNPEVAQNGINPLIHFLLRGADEGRCPHPLFDTSYYLDRNPEVAQEGINPLVHFVLRGADEGRSPHPLFDTSYYLEHSPDIGREGVNPLIHFIQRGGAEGRRPHLLFDSAFYHSQTHDPAREGEEDPLSHYLTKGALRGLDPNPYFSTRYYLASNSDVAGSGQNPLVHYVEKGMAQGRRPSTHFDPRYYLRNNPDLATLADALLIHYLKAGAGEGRRPCEYPEDLSSVANGADIRSIHGYLASSTFKMFCSTGAALDFTPPPEVQVSVILVLHNRAALTFKCLESLLQETRTLPMEVVVVDNASTDATDVLLERSRGLRLIRNSTNVGFVDACNQAAGVARGRLLLFLNNDTQVLTGAISAAVATLQSDKSIGAVGARVVMLDGRLQEAGSIIWRDGSTAGYGRGERPESGKFTFQRDVDYCSGVFLLTPRTFFERAGGFDSRFRPAYYEDADYCMTLRGMGLRTVYEPRAVVLHYEHASSTPWAARDRMASNRESFRTKHASVLAREHLPPSPGSQLEARGVRAPGRLKVLYVDDRVPHRALGAGFPRANAFVNSLAKLGHQVTIYPCQFLVGEDWPNVHQDVDRRIEVMNGEQGLRKHLESRTDFYDLIIISRIHNYETFLRESCLDLKGSAKIIYDSEAIFAIRDHRAKALRGESATEAELRAAIDQETKTVDDADAVTAVSETEATFFMEAGKKQTFILGHSCPAAATGTPFENRDTILFVGAMHEDQSPNVDALMWFVTRVLPHIAEQLDSAFVFRVVGLNKSDMVTALSHPRLEVVGDVADLRPEYERSRLLVAPIRYGAGISLKTYESAAAGVPVVASSLLAHQLSWHPGQDLLVADDPEEFAARCVELYTRPELWHSVREQALDSVRQDCDPARFTQRVKELCAWAVGDALPDSRA